MTQDPNRLGVSVIPWRHPSADPPPDDNQLIAVVTKHGENTRTSTTQASWVVDSPEDYIAKRSQRDFFYMTTVKPGAGAEASP